MRLKKVNNTSSMYDSDFAMPTVLSSFKNKLDSLKHLFNGLGTSGAASRDVVCEEQYHGRIAQRVNCVSKVHVKN
jgi:hypothetical protein